MPRELKSQEQFEQVLPKAVELRIVRGAEDSVKVKVRTPEYLYTYKTTEDEAQDIIKNAKELEVVEINPAKDKKESGGKQAEDEEKKPATKKQAKKKQSQPQKASKKAEEEEEDDQDSGDSDKE